MGHGPAVDVLIAVRDHLAADDRCAGKVAVVGFCTGGGFCLQLAPRGVFDAAAPNYGQLPKDVDVPRRSCPVVESYGARDNKLPKAAATLETVLTEGSSSRCDGIPRCRAQLHERVPHNRTARRSALPRWPVNFRDCGSVIGR
jgi:dienelactone hydrolase